jgi:hypothetical protein
VRGLPRVALGTGSVAKGGAIPIESGAARHRAGLEGLLHVC